MERQLINRFEEYFPSMDAPVKDEEILIFLDKSYQNKFDRKIFNEIKEKITAFQHKKLTPRNFAKTYYTAYRQLRTSEDQAQRQIETLRLTRKTITAGASGSRPQNFSGYGIRDSDAQQKASGGTFENQVSIGVSNVVGNDGEVHEMRADQLVMVEFDPLNLHEFPQEFLDFHSIQTVFGRRRRGK